MTVLRLSVSDQHLIAAQKVKIAAGDINSVLLHVDFDAAWDDFGTRKALFENDSANSDTQDIFLVGGECVIPHEVLSNAGVLSISVTGYTANGETKKTSTIVKMKVLPSLTDATTTIAPTTDLFMQYLAAMESKMHPVMGNVDAKLAEYKGTIATIFAKFASELSGDVLWENPDPYTYFRDLTLNIDRTPYKMLKIHAIEDVLKEGETIGDGSQLFRHEISVFENGTYLLGAEEGDAHRRGVVVTDTSIRINHPAVSGGDDLIPYKIVGYKYVHADALFAEIWEMYQNTVLGYAERAELAARTTEGSAEIVANATETAVQNKEEAVAAAANAKESEENAAESETVASQALSDLLAMINGGDIVLATNGKIPLSAIPATATHEIYAVTSEDELTSLVAQRGDLAELIEEIEGERTITKTWQCLGDASVRENWVVWGTSYSVQSGNATTADNATNANMINNHRIIEMAEEDFENAVKDDDTYYLVY